jgi:hypothetical protein
MRLSRNVQGGQGMGVVSTQRLDPSIAHLLAQDDGLGRLLDLKVRPGRAVQDVGGLLHPAEP